MIRSKDGLWEDFACTSRLKVTLIIFDHTKPNRFCIISSFFADLTRHFLAFLALYDTYLVSRKFFYHLKKSLSPFVKNHRKMLPQVTTQSEYATIRHAVMDILVLNLVEKLMTHHLVHRPNGNGILGHLPDG